MELTFSLSWLNLHLAEGPLPAKLITFSPTDKLQSFENSKKASNAFETKTVAKKQVVVIVIY